MSENETKSSAYEKLTPQRKQLVDNERISLKLKMGPVKYRRECQEKCVSFLLD